MLNSCNNRSLLTALVCAALASGSLTAAAATPESGSSRHHCSASADGLGWDCDSRAAEQVDIALPKKTPEPATSGDKTTPNQTAAPEIIAPSAIVESAAAKPAAAQQVAPEQVTAQPANAQQAPEQPIAVQQITGPHAHLDWVAREHFTEAQALETPRYCAGAYVEPEYVSPEARTLAPESQPLSASAISSEGLFDGLSTLRGDVVIKQGNLLLESNETSINRVDNTADVVGVVKFRQPGVLLIGNDAHLKLDTNEVTIESATFIAHESHMRGSAEQINLANDLVTIRDGQFTRCEPGVNSWAIRGDEIELDQQTGVGTARDATLRVRGVPILYTPYIRFPIDDRRKSGFLFPTLGSSSDGAEIALPYYLNIAPNYDATVTPRYIADRGAMGELELRYLHSNNTGTLSGGFLADDDEFGGEDRWRGQLQHKGTLFEHISTLVNYTTLSDEDYLSDLGAGLDTTSQTYVLRLGQASYKRDYWSLTAKLLGYQILDEELADASQPYDQLPQLALNISYPHEATGLEFGLDVAYAYFDRDNENLTIADQAATTKTLLPAIGTRINATPSIGLNLEWPFAYLRPQARYKYIGYDLDDIDTTLDTSPDVGTPVYSVDSGLFFERDTSLFGTELLQTFEPRLFYLNVPEEDQTDLPDFDSAELNFSYSQLFRDDRFIGGDRIGDTEQLSVGLTTRFIDTSGFERFRTSLGQIFYSQDRSVTLAGVPGTEEMTNESAYAAELLFALRSGWQVRGNIEWDPEAERTNEDSISLTYRSDNRHIFNLGYRARRSPQQIEQTNIALIWPLSTRWSFIGRWNQDIINDRAVEALAGIEYQSCCWSARIVGRQWINDDDLTAVDNIEEREGIYLQFQFKGLAGVGESLERIMRNSIAGYQEQTEYEF